MAAVEIAATGAAGPPRQNNTPGAAA